MLCFFLAQILNPDLTCEYLGALILVSFIFLNVLNKDITGAHSTKGINNCVQWHFFSFHVKPPAR